jgi:hypothetical protein
LLGAEVGVGEGGGVPLVAEFLELLEVEPWLDPDLGLVELLPPGLDGLEREVVQRAGHHLLLGLHHAHELQQRVLNPGAQMCIDREPPDQHRNQTNHGAPGGGPRSRSNGRRGRGR